MSSSRDANPVSLETLEALESRLKQVEFYVTGRADGPPSTPVPTDATAPSVRTRLQNLEEGLRGLSSKNQVVADILNLQQSHPALFPPHLSPSPSTFYTPAQKSSILLAMAPLISTTAARLTTLKESPVPPVEVSTNLIAMAPRLARLELLREERWREVDVLRERTAVVLNRWYQMQVLEAGECWVEWEERLLEVEREVRRGERRREEDEDVV